MSNSSGPSTNRSRFEWLIPAGLFALFLLITLPGISWGAPDVWHPDEIVKEAGLALSGESAFDEENFDYPSLPKYVLYGLGKGVISLGYGDAEFLTLARSLSALLGGLRVVLAYAIARLLGGQGMDGASQRLAAYLQQRAGAEQPLCA